MIATPKMMGQRVKRKEDPRFITGQGKYTDDVMLLGMIHAAFLRSDRGHARIRSVDVSAARASKGVLAVYTGKDLEGKVGGVPCGVQNAEGKHYSAGVPLNVPPYPVLAINKVTFVGHMVAVVLAETIYLAQDAVEKIEVDYEDLPAVVDVERAIQPDSPVIHEEFGTNIAFTIENAPSEEMTAETKRLFEQAELRESFRFDNQRLIPMALEPRAVVAEYDGGREQLTVWSSSQIPHIARTLISATVGVPETHVRFIAPDVGGGFGSKLNLYAEEILISWLAREHVCPIKWTERRREGFTNTTHGRGQVQHVEIAFQRDGTWLAARGELLLDLGAQMQLLTPAIGGFTTVMMTGCYNPKAYSFRHLGVFTNKTATDAYRGAGRPEATMIAEKAMDVIARATGLDPAEVRRKNFLREFPATPPTGLVYDSGDYAKALDKALEVTNYSALREEQKRARAEGRLFGVGMCSYVELCGVGPSWLAPPGVGFWDVCTIKAEPSGLVSVLTGISPHGQGQETTFAQIVSDELGVPMENIRVLHSDTAVTPYGNGTYGSRGMAVGGGALIMSVNKVKDKARKYAARMLDVQEDNIVYENGELLVRGDSSRKLRFEEVAHMAYDFSWKGPGTVPEDIEPGLEATSRFEPSNLTFPFGTHICVLEIDRDTGEVQLKRFVAVDDCGHQVNPMIVEGQVHGGIAQGMAQALYEGVVYDENGQLLTGELTEYAVPKASMLCHFETHSTHTPTPVNPLGAKGVGEAGTIGATAAVFNAVLDALQPLGIKHLDMPFTPHKLWSVIQQQA